MRAPAIPLITIDPYFSVWSTNENLNFQDTVHWTGEKNPILGYVTIDDDEYIFLGYDFHKKKIHQKSLSLDALSTCAVFSNEKIELTIKFMTPLLPDDIKLLSRPVSYMEASYKSNDEKDHYVLIKILVRENICLNKGGDSPVTFEKVDIPNIPTIKMGNSVQNVLNRSGDDVRIDWGYFYLSCSNKSATVDSYKNKGDYALVSSTLDPKEGTIFTFAYDDTKSINYFGKQLNSAWNNDGETIIDAIKTAITGYRYLLSFTERFSKDLYDRAEKAGGKKYAEMLSLAYRQVMAAHKVVIDENGEILYISKECSSNGCACTVDVTYPSTPLFLIYNPELVKGMLRPIYKFARSESWKYDFAPHDAGVYPLITGQAYGYDKVNKEYLYEKQMPIEECGNMIITEANIALATKNTDFVLSHLDLLEKWYLYLLKFGLDPENQLCTDDFAGHLAHNCNLSAKAILAIRAMGIIYNLLGKKDEEKECIKQSKQMAKEWLEKAKNADGSYMLAFDMPNSYSMKYNLIWDKVWRTNVFSKIAVHFEARSYFKHFEKYGLPLDSRIDYTKTDWLTWTAALTDTKIEFEKFIEPMYNVLNETSSRIPFADIYDTVSGYMGGMRHRSVQGGLFIKMLDNEGKLQI